VGKKSHCQQRGGDDILEAAAGNPRRNRGYFSTRRAPVRLTYLLLPRSYSKHAAWSNGRRYRSSREGSVTGSQFKTHVQKNGILTFIIMRKVARARGNRTTKPQSAKTEAQAGTTLGGRVSPPQTLIQDGLSLRGYKATLGTFVLRLFRGFVFQTFHSYPKPWRTARHLPALNGVQSEGVKVATEDWGQ
jgi:hypothetical protein